MGLKPLGAAPHNRWGVSATQADLVRPPIAPRPIDFSAEPQDLSIDLARTACIVIDMQNDFCTPGGWLHGIGVDVLAARAPIEPLNALLPRLRMAAVPIVWVNWGNRPDRLNLSPSLLHVYDGEGAGTGLGAPTATGGATLEKDSWVRRSSANWPRPRTTSSSTSTG